MNVAIERALFAYLLEHKDGADLWTAVRSVRNGIYSDDEVCKALQAMVTRGEVSRDRRKNTIKLTVL